VCREAVPQIGGEDWEGPLADGSKVEGWHDQLVGGRRSFKFHSQPHENDTTINKTMNQFCHL